MMVAAYLAIIKAGGVVVATMPLLRARRSPTRLPKRRSGWRCATIASPTKEKGAPARAISGAWLYWAAARPKRSKR